MAEVVGSDQDFRDFVTAELPKRIHSDDQSLDIPAGKILVTSGSGLGVTFEDAASYLNFGLITATDLVVDENGQFTLPSPAIGGIVYETAWIYLLDRSLVEVSGVKTEGTKCTILQADFDQLKGDIASATVTYLGSLS